MIEKIVFDPKKKWFEFWKYKRTLKEGKDYEIDGKVLKTNKLFVGDLEITYTYEKKIN